MKDGTQDEPLDESPTDELPVLTELDVVELDAGPIPPATEDDAFFASDEDDDPRAETGRFPLPEALPEIEPFPESDEELAFLRRHLQLLKAILDDKDAEIATLSEQLRATRIAVERRDETERRLRSDLADAAAQRKQLEARLAEADALAAQYADRVAELTSRLRTLEQEVDQREKAYAELEAELVAREARVVERERALERAEAAAAAASTAHGREAAGASEGTEPARGKPASDTTLAESREEAAALAAYIDCRRAHWLALEAQLDELRLRLQELEHELEQRTERERREAERADAEARRADALKAELARARTRRRTRRTAPKLAESPDESPTATLRAPRLDALPTSDDGAPVFTPAALVCLTSDPPHAYPIGTSPLVIGRGPDCDVRVATHFVSREHARIVRERDRFLIEDLGSKNGVFVNAVRVERAPLQSGDVVTIGETEFRFETGTKAGAPSV